VADPAVADATSTYESQTNTIEVTAELRTTPADPAAAAAELARKQTPPAGVQVHVTIDTQETAVPQDKYIRGGGLLSNCTAGFNLKYRDSDTKRLGTAGHCLRLQSGDKSVYSNHSNAGGSTTVTEVWGHEGSGGDLGYYTTGDKTPTRTYYHNWNKTRYVDSRSSMPSVGTKICLFGKTSGASCAKVKKADVSVGHLRHMVVMDTGRSLGGDSGGPWFYGGKAYGIHFGLINGKSAFTPAYLFQNRKYDVWQR
jgi:hypothetical protein